MSSGSLPSRPKYHELEDGTPRGVFGADDQLGCLNLLTRGRTAAAASLIRSGQVFSLNASVDYPSPYPAGRQAPVHVVTDLAPLIRDDYLTPFYLQYGTQWDHFLHVGDPRTGSFYNGSDDESPGIEDWAERGIAGRGVLLDVARWLASTDEPIDWLSRRVISPSDLARCAEAQAVSVDEGTILLIRVGWQQGWSRLTEEERAAVAHRPVRSVPGLEPSAAMAERLWDWGIAAVASDNPTVEAFPHESYMLHEDLLGRLGIPMGELWLLDELAEACEAAGRYDFFLTSAPLNVHGGKGSPANALAIM